MESLRKELLVKLYSFIYFTFWGFYFSAGYLFCKKEYKSFRMSV